MTTVNYTTERGIHRQRRVKDGVSAQRLIKRLRKRGLSLHRAWR